MVKDYKNGQLHYKIMEMIISIIKIMCYATGAKKRRKDGAGDGCR
jgi:hypothetical protein